MLDIGMQELIVIFVVALVVIGPKRLPELARTLGKGVSQARKAMFDIKSEVEREMDISHKGLEDFETPGKKTGPNPYEGISLSVNPPASGEPVGAEQAGEQPPDAGPGDAAAKSSENPDHAQS